MSAKPLKRRMFKKLFQILVLCNGTWASSPRNHRIHRDTTTSKHDNYKRGSSVATSTMTIANRVIAGGTSRAIAQALLYPVDALRTLAQTRDGRTLADVGMQALLRGCAQTSSFALFTGAIQFGIFGMVNPRCGPLVASACGAAGSCLVSVPQEVIKQRLVTGVYGSFREAASTIWKNEGLLGFYNSWKPTVSRNVPFVVTTFTCRDILRSRLKMLKEQPRELDSKSRSFNSPEVADISTLENLGTGVASALMAVFVTQPIDVIKTRMMTQAASHAAPYTSALDCAWTVLKTEGWQKLYSGIGQRSVYMCGLWGITFMLEPIVTEYLDSKK